MNIRKLTWIAACACSGLLCLLLYAMSPSSVDKHQAASQFVARAYPHHQVSIIDCDNRTCVCTVIVDNQPPLSLLCNRTHCVLDRPMRFCP